MADKYMGRTGLGSFIEGIKKRLDIGSQYPKTAPKDGKEGYVDFEDLSQIVDCVNVLMGKKHG